MFLMRATAPEVLRNTKLSRGERFRQFLAFAASFDHQCAGQAIEWFDQCRRRWRDRHPGLQLETLPGSEKNALIYSTATMIADRTAASLNGAVAFQGYSSGLDSRFLHHLLKRSGLVPGRYTFGQPGNFDFDFISFSEGRDPASPRMFDTAEIPWRLADFERATPMLRDKAVSPRVAVAAQLSLEHDKYLDIHGYLNGSLTGGRAVPQISTTWSDALRVFAATNDQFGFQRFMHASTLSGVLPRRPFDADLSYDCQLDLGYRQHQRIRPADCFGASMVQPFAHEDWIGLWLNMPHRELVGQARYLGMLSELGAEEFFDLNQLRHEGGLPTKERRLELVYGEKQKLRASIAAAAGKKEPIAPTAHFDFYPCYFNNPGFRIMVDASLARLRKRGIFHDAFLDGMFSRFLDRNKAANQMIKGTISIDLAMESDLLE